MTQFSGLTNDQLADVLLDMVTEIDTRTAALPAGAQRTVGMQKSFALHVRADQLRAWAVGEELIASTSGGGEKG